MGVGIAVTVATALEICLSKDGGGMPPLSRVKPLPSMGLAALALHCTVIEDIVLSGLLGLFLKSYLANSHPAGTSPVRPLSNLFLASSNQHVLPKP